MIQIVYKPKFIPCQCGKRNGFAGTGVESSSFSLHAPVTGNLKVGA